MASLQERNGSFRFIFRHNGKQHFVHLGKVARSEAEAKAAQAGYLLLRLKQGLPELPPGVEITEFLRSDGNSKQRIVASRVAKRLTLGSLLDRCFAAREHGRESATIKTGKIHFKHLSATLGETFPLEKLTQAELQRHISRRAKEGVSATTVRKEITTLRTAWHWAADADELPETFPSNGLIYPKEEELPPYQTREEIERQIAAG